MTDTEIVESLIHEAFSWVHGGQHDSATLADIQRHIGREFLRLVNENRGAAPSTETSENR